MNLIRIKKKKKKLPLSASAIGPVLQDGIHPLEIPKLLSGGQANMDNYRPISILPVVSKIL